MTDVPAVAAKVSKRVKDLAWTLYQEHYREVVDRGGPMGMVALDKLTAVYRHCLAQAKAIVSIEGEGEG